MKLNLTMKTFFILMLFVILAVSPSIAGTDQQELDLDPGWNAVFLKIEPDTPDPAILFAGLPPGSSVWTWIGRGSTIEFIQDPSEDLGNLPGMRGWFRDEGNRILSNLELIQGNQAYLINVGGAAFAKIDIDGIPSTRPTRWTPGSFNLVGFHVDVAGNGIPTFDSWFSPSRAHENAAIFKLSSGTWTLVDAALEEIEPETAYWVYCSKASTYQGPLDVVPSMREGFDFNDVLNRLSLKLANLNYDEGEPDVSVTLNVSPESSLPLTYRSLNAAQGKYEWAPVANLNPIVLSPGAERTLTLGIDRSGMASNEVLGILNITCGGMDMDIPVRALQPVQPSLTGLWIGSVALNTVNQVNSGDINTLSPAPAQMILRVLIHRDDTARVRLLKEVFMMARKTDPADRVLITTPDLLHNYDAFILKNGEMVGRRIAAIGFDFQATSYIEFTGGLGTDATLNCNFTLGPEHPTNPFYHRYHPDHDNLEPMGSDPETWEVIRTISIDLDPAYPPGNANAGLAPPAGWGTTMLGGVYTETIQGLHKNPVIISGPIELQRISDEGELIHE